MRIVSKALALICVITCFRCGESLAQEGWFVQEHHPKIDLLAVANVDAQTAVATDTLGRLLRTTDGGQRWVVQFTGPDLSVEWLGRPGLPPPDRSGRLWNNSPQHQPGYHLDGTDQWNDSVFDQGFFGEPHHCYGGG